VRTFSTSWPPYQRHAHDLAGAGWAADDRMCQFDAVEREDQLTGFMTLTWNMTWQNRAPSMKSPELSRISIPK
jgi:hypothetical protein